MSQSIEKQDVIYEFDKFTLCPKERILLSDGKKIHLTDKVFDTLLLLIEHNGRLLTKSEMIDRLWDDAFVEEGNLAKNISRLRKILNVHGVEHIETTPKRGYRFTADVRQICGDTSLRIDRNLKIKIMQETADGPVVALPPKRRGVSLLLISVLGVFGIAAVGAAWWSMRAAPAERSRINSIAVMPLTPLSRIEDNSALGIGLSDALITRLGSIDSITVRPISAVMRFSDSQSGAVEAGQKLNVDAVLDGSIQQSDGRLRVNARLTRVASGEQIWTEKFDEPVANIFDLQDALSLKIAGTLAAKLSGAEQTLITRRPTANVDAYSNYLRGRYYQNQNTKQGLTKAIEFYEQAIALDPKFADAHAGMADALLILYNFSLRPPSEVLPRARQSVDRAIDLNPNLPDAYNAQALIQFLADHDWPAAERSLQKAIELDPNNANSYLRYGYFLIAIGNFPDAQIKLDKALLLNPTSSVAKADIGLLRISDGQFGSAIEQLEQVVVENPDVELAWWFLGAAYEANGDPGKGFDAYMRALDSEGRASLAARLTQAKASVSLEAAYKLWRNEWSKARGETYVPAINLAFLSAELKDREQTLVWLETALSEGDPTLWQIKFQPTYDFIRDEPRFQEIQRRLNL